MSHYQAAVKDRAQANIKIEAFQLREKERATLLQLTADKKRETKNLHEWQKELRILKNASNVKAEKADLRLKIAGAKVAILSIKKKLQEGQIKN
jgi:hypothetical protein